MGRARHHAASQHGFTLVEVLVAVLILAVGILGSFAALDSSSHLNLVAQRQEAAALAAEQAMEQVRALPYNSIALSSTPSHSSDGNAPSDHSGNPSNPNYWVSGSNLLIVSNFSQESSSTLSGVSSSGEAFVTGGSVNPGPTTVSSNGYTASVYTYITWFNDKCVLPPLGDLCPGTQDGKRITIAVVLNSGGNGVQKPVWLSTVVANPQAGISS